MIYIKENSDGRVTLAGEVANQTMLDEGYVQYNGTIPTYDPSYQYLTLDATGNLVVNDDLIMKDHIAYMNRKQAMLDGQIFTLNAIDYKVSLTSNDAAGVMQLFLANQNGAITTTNFIAKNGTVVPLTSSDINTFVNWFTAARQTFFQPGQVLSDPLETSDTTPVI